MGNAESTCDRGDDDGWLRLTLRFVGGLIVLFVVVLAIGHYFSAEAQGLAWTFVDELGIWGLALGTLLADGLQFPVPPQFYMFIGISAGTPPALTLFSIGLASVIGGLIGFSIARAASRLSWAEPALRRLFSSSRLRVGREHPYKFVLVSSLTPVPFSLLCYAAGLSGFPVRAFLLLGLLRLPKLVLYYAIVRAGWTSLGSS